MSSNLVLGFPWKVQRARPFDLFGKRHVKLCKTYTYLCYMYRQNTKFIGLILVHLLKYLSSFPVNNCVHEHVGNTFVLYASIRYNVVWKSTLSLQFTRAVKIQVNILICLLTFYHSAMVQSMTPDTMETTFGLQHYYFRLIAVSANTSLGKLLSCLTF